jgi:hypothetical protein
MHRDSPISREPRWRAGCALLLLLSFVLPVLSVVQAWGTSNEEFLPACCRSHGKHKCFKRAVAAASDSDTRSTVRIAQVSERCPCGLPSQSVVSGDHNSLIASFERFLVAPLQNHLFLLCQRNTNGRIAPTIRQRGPPFPS